MPYMYMYVQYICLGAVGAEFRGRLGSFTPLVALSTPKL